MSYTINTQTLTEFGQSRQGEQGPIRVMFQSLTAAGVNSVADLENGFDRKVTLRETRTWSSAPDRASWIGSMGRIAGDADYDETGLKGEGIKLAAGQGSFIINVDGTGEQIDEDTPLSVYAGVDQFDADIIADMSFDTHTDLEKAMNELTDGKAAWVRITIPKGPFSDSEANVLNRSVPGGRESGRPLKELGPIQTIFNEQIETSGLTFEGYYLPRESYSHADGIYYGLTDESPGFLHVHCAPTDINEPGRLDEYNVAIQQKNTNLADGQAPHSIGGHTLRICGAENVQVEIMIPDVALVKAGYEDGFTVMRPCLVERDLQWEAEERARIEEVAKTVNASGADTVDNIVNLAVEKAVVTRAGEKDDSLAAVPSRVQKALAGRVGILTLEI